MTTNHEKKNKMVRSVLKEIEIADCQDQFRHLQELIDDFYMEFVEQRYKFIFIQNRDLFPTRCFPHR